jgi:subtilisin family serine protease
VIAATRAALQLEGVRHGLVQLGDGEMLRLASGPAPDELRIRTPLNVNAADTANTDQLQPGGSLGLNLTGSGYTVGVWDAGLIRNTHQEFGSRVTLADSGSFHYHSTHVGGTIGASGVVASAQGMATQVALRSREWTNDVAELSSDAALIDVSNHSYGYVTGWAIYLASDYGFSTPSGTVDVWFEDRYLYASEDTDFGKYVSEARDLDVVLQDNPDLLSVWAASNDRDDAYTNASTNNTYVAWFSAGPGGIGWSGEGWYLVSTSSFPAPGGDGNAGAGYDSIGGMQTAKNALVVGAVNDVLSDPYTPGQIVTTGFSSYGPMDDGRIKPDVVGNGAGLYSTYSSSDTAYTTLSGTSMASPNVAGTAVLLIEHFEDEFLTAPRSATTKGVLIHTATDAGNTGPAVDLLPSTGYYVLADSGAFEDLVGNA